MRELTSLSKKITPIQVLLFTRHSRNNNTRWRRALPHNASQNPHYLQRNRNRARIIICPWSIIRIVTDVEPSRIIMSRIHIRSIRIGGSCDFGLYITECDFEWDPGAGGSLLIARHGDFDEAVGGAREGGHLL